MGAEAVVEQFSLQAASFARLPSHEEATQRLLEHAGADGAGALLDVACGPGLVACAAARRARRVVGVDLTPAMIGQARALQARLGLTNIEWRIGEACALPFANASFDAVTTRYSLHHFPDPDLAVAELVRVARPGARVAIADLVLPREQGAAYDRMERLRDPSHVRTLSREELSAIAVGAGLRALRHDGYLFSVGLEQLMKASFPRAGDAERVRAIFEVDVGVEAMGLALERNAGDIRLTYPVAVVSGEA